MAVFWMRATCPAGSAGEPPNHAAAILGQPGGSEDGGQDNDLGEGQRAMERVNGTMLRLALAVPLAYEAYRLASFSARATSWNLDSLLVNRGLK